MPRSNPAGRRGVIDIDARGRRTEKLIATVQAAGEEDVDSAVKAARALAEGEAKRKVRLSVTPRLLCPALCYPLPLWPGQGRR